MNKLPGRHAGIATLNPEGRVDYCAVSTIRSVGLESQSKDSPWPFYGLVGSNPAPGASHPRLAKVISCVQGAESKTGRFRQSSTD